MSLRIRDEQLRVLEDDMVSDRLFRFVTWMRDVLGVPLPADGARALEAARVHLDALRKGGVVDHRDVVEHVGRAMIERELAAGWQPPEQVRDEVGHVA